MYKYKRERHVKILKKKNKKKKGLIMKSVSFTIIIVTYEQLNKLCQNHNQ